MYTKWTQHIQDPEDKVHFENKILGSTSVLERLSQILTEEQNLLDRSEMDIKTFDLPNWEYKQAYKNGYRAALEVVKKLINLDQQRKTND